MMSDSSEFSCKCGQKGWITEGKETPPCPECGRTYIGYYDSKVFTIAGKEVKKVNSEPQAFPKCAGYEDLRKELKNLPDTWYPDLLRAMIEEISQRKIFKKPNGLSNFLRQCQINIE
jgi:hypothetical protein